MAALGYLEVLDPKGRVAQRFPVQSLPLTVGRAYTNHVILDDPFVCPEHLAIGYDENGRLRARDVGTVNGLREIAGGQPVPSLLLASGTEFQIGHTHLRYCETAHAVAPAEVDRAGIMRWFTSPVVGLASGFLVLMVLLVNSFFGSYERLNIARSLSEALTTFSVVLVWAGLWALVSRIVLNRFHYGQHFVLACAAIIVSLLINTAAEWIEFIFPKSEALWVTAIAGSGFILAALVCGHLGLASSMRLRPRLWAGLGLSVAVIGLGVMADYANRSSFSTVMEYSGILKPIEPTLLPATTMDRFIESTQHLKKELDALARKARSSQP
jgi:FHA domain